MSPSVDLFSFEHAVVKDGVLFPRRGNECVNMSQERPPPTGHFQLYPPRYLSQNRLHLQPHPETQPRHQQVFMSAAARSRLSSDVSALRCPRASRLQGVRWVWMAARLLCIPALAQGCRASGMYRWWFGHGSPPACRHTVAPRPRGCKVSGRYKWRHGLG